MTMNDESMTPKQGGKSMREIETFRMSWIN